jgi:WD40 repeat protein
LNNRAAHPVPFGRYTLWCLAFSPDGESLIVGGGAPDATVQDQEKTIGVVNLKSCAENKCEPSLRRVGNAGAVLNLTFGPAEPSGGSLLAIASGNYIKNDEDSTLALVNYPSLGQLPLFQQFTEANARVMFIPGGSLLITQSAGGIRLWDLSASPAADKDGLIIMTGLYNARAALSTDGQRLLVAGGGQNFFSVDLSVPKYILRAAAGDILANAEQRTQLSVKGLTAPKIGQAELAALLKKAGYDSNFEIIPLPETSAPRPPQGMAGGSNRDAGP